jgi:erythromycin esterase-like protein
MPAPSAPANLAAQLAALSLPVDAGCDAVVERAHDREFVLLGEASHGTQEFYALRAALTRRLIVEQGVDAVCVEGDWPDVERLNRYAIGAGEDDLDAAFGDFQRFPTWLWANTVVREFIAWLRTHNDALAPAARVGIHGMDLYSLYRSMGEVLRYLEAVDPAQAAAARRLYGCFDHVDDPQDYAASVAYGLSDSCREAAHALLVDLVRNGPRYRALDGAGAVDAQFVAERNAHVVLNAEEYYRGMFSSRANTWNLRDAHMVETLQALRRHLRARGRGGRIAVWAHNSHLGDARATQMGRRGEWNVGQLLREQCGAERVLLVGLTTHAGTVTAARDWDGHAERRRVRSSHPDSIERLLHEVGQGHGHGADFWLSLSGEAAALLAGDRLERAIGVIYRPESELQSHYFPADVAAQFDALFHLDMTQALRPLAANAHWERGEPSPGEDARDNLPDTWPFGT